jgi:hypothetical protein
VKCVVAPASTSDEREEKKVREKKSGKKEQ